MRRFAFRAGARVLPPAYHIAINDGDGQTATVLTEVATDPEVVVTLGGVAAAGLVVDWASQTGSSLSGAVTRSTVTDAMGLTSTPWTLGPDALDNTLIATVRLTGHRVTFTATGTASGADSLLANSATSQAAVVDDLVSVPPSVKVVDPSGNPRSGQAIVWAVAGGGGSLDDTGATTTDANGVATLVSWTTGAVAGLNSVTATAAGLEGSPITFTASAVAVVPTTIAISAGDDQTGVVAGAAGATLTVLVQDDGPNPIEDVTVNWAALSGGGSVSAPTSLSNASGLASITPTTGTGAGPNVYRASIALADGSIAFVDFDIATVAGTATKLVMVSQGASNTQSGQTLPGAPIVGVADTNGNLVTSATDTITGTIVSGNGSLAGNIEDAVAGQATFSALVLTDADGGSDTIRYSAPGLTSVDGPAIAVAPPNPDHLLMVTQPTGGTEDSPMAVCVVRVVDASNVTIPGYAGQITAAIGTNPAGGTLSGTTAVNCVNGVANFSNLILDNAGVGYTLVFSGGAGITGVTSAAFTVSVPNTTFPEEPAGFTPHPSFPNGNPFSGANAAWTTTGAVSFRDGSTYVPPLTSNLVTITPPGQGPISAPWILEYRLNKDHVAGIGSGTCYFTNTLDSKGWHELFIQGVFKVASNWYGEASGQCKTIQPSLATGGTANRVIFSPGGAGTAAMKWRVAFQSIVPGGPEGWTAQTGNLNPIGGTGSITRSQWHRAAVYVKANTSGQFNGICRSWLDGVMTHNYVAMQFNATAFVWRNAILQLLYGGSSGTAPDDSAIYWDDYYVSGHV